MKQRGATGLVPATTERVTTGRQPRRTLAIRNRVAGVIAVAALATLAACSSDRSLETSAGGIPVASTPVATDQPASSTTVTTASVPTTTVPTTTATESVPPSTSTAPASTGASVEAADLPAGVTLPEGFSLGGDAVDDPGLGTVGVLPDTRSAAWISPVSIAVPKIDITRDVLEGVGLDVLDQGLGHWPGSALPGHIGNMVIAGHRMSHGHVFRDLDLLVPGDELIATSPEGTFTYRVTRTEIVTPDAIWITDQTDTATATLFACHPKGSTRQRIVVFLELT